MTNEEMRVEIAKELGWTMPVSQEMPSISGCYPPFGRMPNDTKWETLPNWPADLNACHEMENALTNEQRRHYVKVLVEVHPLKYSPFREPDDDREMHVYFLVNATAPQRCTAFVKTVNRWKD